MSRTTCSRSRACRTAPPPAVKTGGCRRSLPRDPPALVIEPRLAIGVTAPLRCGWKRSRRRELLTCSLLHFQALEIPRVAPSQCLQDFGAERLLLADPLKPRDPDPAATSRAMLWEFQKQAPRPGVDVKSPDNQPVPRDLDKADHAAFCTDWLSSLGPFRDCNAQPGIARTRHARTYMLRAQ